MLPMFKGLVEGFDAARLQGSPFQMNLRLMCVICGGHVERWTAEQTRGDTLKIKVRCHGKSDVFNDSVRATFCSDRIDFFTAELAALRQAQDEANKYGETVAAVIQSEIL